MRGDRRPPAEPPPDRPGRPPQVLSGQDDDVYRDPYLRWAVDAGFTYLHGYQDPDTDPNEMLPFLIKLKKGLTAAQFAGKKDWGDGVEPPADLDEWFKIPSIYASPPEGLGPLEFCTVEVKANSVERLRQEPFKSVLEQYELSDPLGTIQAPFDADKLIAVKTGPKPKVIVGVIDDGLPFANARFRDTNITTRIEFFWDQDRPVGKHLSKYDIDKYLKDSEHAGLVDEDEVYRRAGYTYNVSGHKSWARRATHGGHVMDLACGLNISEVRPASPRIIGVQLPAKVTADPAGIKLFAQAVIAVVYILHHADKVAAAHGVAPLPVVINLSYGVNQGPHDGTSFFEWAIDRITSLRRAAGLPFTMVLASGNSHLTRCHAHFALLPVVAPSHTLEWRVQPDDATPSFIDIWLPYDAEAGQVVVEVDTPDLQHLGPVHEGDPDFHWPSKAAPLLTVQHSGVPPPFGTRNVIIVTLLPTTTLGVDPVAQSGTWRVTVRNVKATPVVIDAWIWRDDTPFGYPIRGRQSRFDDPRYERFDSKGHLSEVDAGASYIKRDSSISGLATGLYTVVIGGCRRSNLASARYSAGGPTLKPNRLQSSPRTGPDATAYAEWSVAAPGMLATGTRSGSVVTVNGTSVSAPQVTRWIASQMAAGLPGDRQGVANQGLKDPTPNIPAIRGNYGYVDPGYSRSKIDRSVPL